MPRTAGGCRPLLAPGQRLVSREGALWRWDGLTASADAPTAAAQRLAQKNRLAELDAEAVAATLVLRDGRSRTCRGRAGGSQGESRPSATPARPGAMPSTGWATRATRWPRPKRPAASLSAGAPPSTRRAPASSTDLAEAAAAFAEAETQLQNAPDLGDLQTAARTIRRQCRPRSRRACRCARRP